MTDIFCGVPQAPEPTAEPYARAHAHACSERAKFPGRFAKWYVENGIGLAVADAWAAAPEDVKVI